MTKKIIVNDVSIIFSDDIWDFRSLHIPGKDAGRLKFDFGNINNPFYNDHVKIYCMYKIFQTSIYNTSIVQDINALTDFLNFYCDLNFEDYFDLTISVVKNHIHNLEELYSYRTIVKKMKSICDFLKFLELLLNVKFDKEIFDYLKKRDNHKLKALQEQNKRPLLPSSFVSTLEKNLYSLIMANETSYLVLAVYCVVYILMQTGVRPTEAAITLYDCMEKKKVDKDKTIYYYNYRTTINNSYGYEFCQTKGNEKLYNVIQQLKKHKQRDDKLLFDVQLTSFQINYYLRQHLFENLEVYKLINTNNSAMFSSNKKASELFSLYHLNKYNVKEDDIISLPHLAQFRVYFASEMHNRGVSDITIGKMLNHHDDKMLGYYGREANEIQENLPFSKSVLKYVIDDGYKILGTRAKQYMDQIETFLAYDSSVVEPDVEHIKENILNQMPIRSLYGVSEK